MMLHREFASLVALGFIELTGCATAGLAYLPPEGGETASQQIEPVAHETDDSVTFGKVRLRPNVCEGINVKPEFELLNESSVIDFLKQRSYTVNATRARNDLVYLDVADGAQHTVRLRVAILDSANAAGRDLHEALLQHGPGSWGVHRSNLAILAPIGDPDDVVAFAAKTKLACWGVLTVAGRDDTFVIPGAYTEL